MNERELLTVSEAAQLLNVAKSTLYCWVEKQLIPHFKIIGSVRLERSEVEGWLLGKKRGGEGATPTRPQIQQRCDLY